MHTLSWFSWLVFLASFTAVYLVNSGSQDPFVFSPPYTFTPASWTEFSAVFFVLFVSLLFFGYAAPIAMAIEGLTFGSLISTGTPIAYLLFAMPLFLASNAGIVLGKAALSDYKGFANVTKNAKMHVINIVASIVLTAIILFAYPYVKTMIG